MRYPIFPPLLLLAWVSVACSGGTQKGPGTMVPEDPFEDPAFTCGEWAKVACVERVTSSCLAESTEACVETQSAFCLSLIPADYDPSTAEACIAAVEKAYADARLTPAEVAVVLDGDGACEFIEQTAAMEGGRCDEDTDCNGSLRCKIPTGELTGVCIVADVVGGGLRCTESNQICDVGFYCNGMNCIARQNPGESCSPDVPCLEDLACEGLPGERVCISRGRLGATCTFDADCLSTICQKAAGANTGLCANEIILSGTEPICENLR